MILNFLILLIDQLLLKFGRLQSDVLLLTQPTNLIHWNFPGFGLHCPLPGLPHSNHYHCWVGAETQCPQRSPQLSLFRLGFL